MSSPKILRLPFVVPPGKGSCILRFLSILAGIIVSLLNLGVRADEVWNQSVSDVWSNDTLWQDNTAPPASGDPALVLRFIGDLPSSFQATNDLGAPFALNRLILESHSFGAITIASASGNSLDFAGTSPLLSKAGIGTATVSSPMTLHGSGGVVTVDG